MVWVGDEKDEPVFLEIHKQTDRAAALIAMAYLEQKLLVAIKARLNENEKVENNLFKGSGPLGSLSAKVDLALLMGIIEGETHKILHTLREIRNEFAHVPEPRSFNSQRINDLCKNIQVEVDVELVERSTKKSTRVKIDRATNPKDAFLNGVKMAVFLVGMETRQLPLRKPAPAVVRWDENNKTLPRTPATPPPP